jgi:hypothetical protein
MSTPHRADRRIVPVSEPEYVRPKDAAKLLGISEKHLERLRNTGDGPPFSKPSYKLVLYRLDDLRAWAGRNTVNNTTHARELVGVTAGGGR